MWQKNVTYNMLYMIYALRGGSIYIGIQNNCSLEFCDLFIHFSSIPIWLCPNLAFPRDRTNRTDVPLSLCPGTKKFSHLCVLLSQDKGRSKNPGTRWIYIYLITLKKIPKKWPDFLFWNILSCFRMSFSI